MNICPPRPGKTCPCGERSLYIHVGTDIFHGVSRVVEGMAGWDGAMPLQMVHLSFVAAISLVIPGQKMDDSALAVILLVP